MVSWALCIFEWVRAVRVIRRGSVAESYMDSLAVTLQSMRSKGWKRFLVFAELTKSKKGVDYIALFVYFAFKGALRIILAEGPRQVVNAITLYSFMQSDLIPTGDHAATQNRSAFEQFWVNVETLADSNREQAVVLFTMLFTLVIWVISALCLLISVILYLLFLWHYIPQSDGRLSIYCRRKIDRRLEKIVGQKVKQALEEQEKKHAQDEAKAAKRANQLPNRPQVNRKPTLPQVAAQTPDLAQGSGFGLSRQETRDTQSRPYPTRTNTAPLAPIQRKPTASDMHRIDADQPRLPPSRNFTAPASTLQRQPTLPDLNLPTPARTATAPPTMLHRQPTLPDLDAAGRRPPMPYRSDTEASALSNVTYASNAPLLGNANEMGESDDAGYFPIQPRPTFDSSTSYASSRVPSLGRQYSNTPLPMLNRSMTPGSQQPQRPIYDDRHEQWGYDRDSSPEPMEDYERSHTYDMPTYSDPSIYTRPSGAGSLPQHKTQQSFHRPLIRMGSGLSFSSRQMSEPEIQSFEMTVQPRSTTTQPERLDRVPEPSQYQAFRPVQQPQQQRSASANTGGYVAFNPALAPAAAGAMSSVQPPERSYTSPPEIVRLPSDSALQRSATAPPESAATYDDHQLIEEYRNEPQQTYHVLPARSATAAPGQHRYNENLPARSATAGPEQQQYDMRHGW